MFSRCLNHFYQLCFINFSLIRWVGVGIYQAHVAYTGLGHFDPYIFTEKKIIKHALQMCLLFAAWIVLSLISLQRCSMVDSLFKIYSISLTLSLSLSFSVFTENSETVCLSLCQYLLSLVLSFLLPSLCFSLPLSIWLPTPPPPLSPSLSLSLSFPPSKRKYCGHCPGKNDTIENRLPIVGNALS